MKKIALVMAIGVLSFVFGTTANAQSKEIGMEKARKIATKKAKGKIESEELEKENGKMVYSFDIRNKKGTITEVHVDAFTGKILSVEEETAEQEAAEKREEANEKNVSDEMDESNEMDDDGDSKAMNRNKEDDDDDKDESPEVKKANMAKYAKEAKITLIEARAIALKRVPGTIIEEDLEKENGKLQYSFDVKDKNGKIFDIEIDAKTGKVLKAVEDKEDEDGDN